MSVTYKKLSVLGSTGSIGTQALEIVEAHPEMFEVIGLTANSNWEKLADQVNRFEPDYVLLCDESLQVQFESRLTWKPKKIFYGADNLTVLATLDEADTILNALVGFAGFRPTYESLIAGKHVALANKESLVVGGELIYNLIGENRGLLTPVDSEHSAMLQCLVGEESNAIRKIIITASGGPFHTWTTRQMGSVSVEDALNHPNWSMGAKITIDSSTMMNKGLEIIEAHWLFDLPVNKIEPVIHPQSIVHSVIEFMDGSSKAQLGPPDMKVPITYALTCPDRLAMDITGLDWSGFQQLTFEPVDYERFPCLRMAVEAATMGGHAPAVLNAANEVAVERFLKKEIGYIDIYRVVEKCLEQVQTDTEVTVESLTETDLHTRELAKNL